MQKLIGTDRARCLQSLLREVRMEAGLMQVQVAERLGTGQAVVSNYETGQRRLDVLELWQVCDAIELPLDVFVQRLMRTCKDV